eukprot:354922-Chlamydomonas_euryale.AAC.12
MVAAITAALGCLRKDEAELEVWKTSGNRGRVGCTAQVELRLGGAIPARGPDTAGAGTAQPPPPIVASSRRRRAGGEDGGGACFSDSVGARSQGTYILDGVAQSLDGVAHRPHVACTVIQKRHLLVDGTCIYAPRAGDGAARAGAEQRRRARRW